MPTDLPCCSASESCTSSTEKPVALVPASIVLPASCKRGAECLSNIRKKRKEYQKTDKSVGGGTASAQELLQVAEAADDQCELCGCTMLFENYKPWCQYQFSFDRLDNSRGHSVENVRVICYACNADGGSALVRETKGCGPVSVKTPCVHGCH